MGSLSKAYGLIERMSEDVDIKVVLSAEASTWPQNKLRRYLGDEVRGRVAKALESIGLIEDLAFRCSLNGNQLFVASALDARLIENQCL